ncbi:MAG: hypothetical protein R3C05_25330 [Pirellulaceae bacterium]
MQNVFDSLLKYVAGNWPELIWIVIAAGAASYLAGRKSRTLWRNREFLDRLNVSLTSIQDGRLKIRTILEMDINDIFLNRAASSKIVELAKQTVPGDPLIPISDDDSWYYLNAVLNEISERFAVGHLRQDAGLATTAEQYLLCLTCERAGTVRTQKIRAMLVRKRLLEELPAEEPKY